MERLHIRQRGVTDMVHHHVEQNANAAPMRLLDQRAQLLFGAHVGVEASPVQCVIAVIGVMREIAFGAAANPAVDLLQRRADPQGVDAQLLQIIQLLRQAGQIAAVKGAYFLQAVAAAPIAVVIGRVAVLKAIGQHEVDRGVMPAERRRFRRGGGFQQQQAAAGGGGLQRDFPRLTCAV